MAVTGVIFVLFVLVHMYGNLKMFWGPEAYDGYAHHLRVVGEPYIPREGVLWILRVVLLGSLILHVYAAAKTWRTSRAARGTPYNKVNRQDQSYASRTMRWGGVIILAFIIFHLLQFTVLAIHVGGDYDVLGPYERMVAAFNVPLLYAAYFISMALLAMHVRHGVWSALATWGFNKKTRTGTINAIAVVVALALFIGFMAPPTAILLGWIA